MDLPVLIMIIVAAIFVLALIIFVVFSKKQESKEREARIKEIEQLDIEEKRTKRDSSPPPKTETKKTPDQPVKPPSSADPAVPPGIETRKTEPADLPKTAEELPEPADSEQSSIETEPLETPVPSRKYDYGSIFDDDTEQEDDEEESFTVIEKESESVRNGHREDMEGFITGSPAGVDLEDGTEREDEVKAEDIFSTDEELDLDQLEKASATFGVDEEEEEIVEEDEILLFDEDTGEDELPSESDIEDLLDSVVMKEKPKAEPEKPAAPKPPKAPDLEDLDPEERKQHEKARRIARVIINDIRNYNPDKLASGIQAGNIMKTLGVEIERGRRLYIKRVPPEIVKSTNYYREAIINILADGRPDLFGW